MRIKQKKSGFTLVEALVAVIILLIVITATLGAISSSLSYMRYSSDRIKASFLAQDVLEYIRAVRDTNVIQTVREVSTPATWITPFEICSVSSPCKIDTTVSLNIFSNAVASVTNCNMSSTGSDGCILYSKNISDENVIYGTKIAQSIFSEGNIEGWVPSKFTRYVTFEPINHERKGQTKDDEYKVTATVKWTDIGGVERDVVLTTNLFHWQIRPVDND